MKHWILLLVLCQSSALCSLAVADEAKPVDVDKPAIASKSSNLDAFLNNAIEGGLLRPAQSGERVQEQSAVVPDGEGADAVALTFSCDLGYPYDFSEYQELVDYSALVEIRQDQARHGESSALHQAKAYMVFGLYAEARAILNTSKLQKARALEQLTLLLDGSGLYELEYFRQVSLCDEAGEMWLAIGTLAEGGPGGAVLLDRKMSRFRGLPFHIRVDIAALTVPTLEAIARKDLAGKLLASFTEAEIKAASRLQFVQALLEFTPENNADLLSFAERPNYRTSVLANLAISGSDLTSNQKAVLTDELMNAIVGADTERARAANLRLLLTKLGDSADYSTMLSLLDIPTLQNAEAQTEIVNHIDMLIARDFEGDNEARKLIAIEYLLGEAGAAVTSKRKTSLLLSATKFAKENGYTSLLARLSKEVGAGGVSDASDADYAYRAGRYADVFALVARYPDNPEVCLFGALSAIKMQDVSRFAKISAGLDDTPSTALKLIEADALSGAWIVPERYYEIAENQDAAVEAARYARIIALKRAVKEPVPDVGGLATAGSQLNASAERLAIISGAAK